MDENLPPFVAWDGEGCKGENDLHPYSLFGCSLGPDFRIKYFDLSTEDCLKLIIKAERACPKAIHVGFAFGYDVNMIIKDLPSAQLRMLRETSRTYWRGYTLEYIPRKWFKVSYGPKGKRVTAKIFDVFSFYNTAFGKALRKYGIGSKEDLDRIDKGKEERPNFTFNDIEEIELYWETELKYLVQLMDILRDILYRADFKIKSWHGPGALAAYALNQHNTSLYMDKGIEDDIIAASRSAYFGGRFEPFLAGYYEGPIWTYDINSAYGYSLSRLPSLTQGKWIHTYYPDRSELSERRLAFYRISFETGFGSHAMPLPHREPNGSVSFPNATNGWFHASEAYLVKDDPQADFKEAWIFEDDGSYPFNWVGEYFDERLRLQAIGDPTEKAYKWAIASFYGQLAQRAGWKRTRKAPRWHQLEYAGSITSECRSLVYSVARQAGPGLVSIDTDGIISCVPVGRLPGGSGDRLGQWKIEKYTGILYLQSGIYWLRDESGNWLPPKSRGIPRKKLDFDVVKPMVDKNENLTVNQHMFIGFGLALRGRMGDWRKWVDQSREVTFGGTGKRFHSPNLCNSCKEGKGWGEALHLLIPRPNKEIDSKPHYLPWLEELEPVNEQREIETWTEV